MTYTHTIFLYVYKSYYIIYYIILFKLILY